MNIASNRGFTLVDIIATVAFVGIIAMMSTPSTTQLIERYQLRGATSQIGMELVRARMQAIAQNRSVRIRFTGDREYVVERSLDDGTFGVVVAAVSLPQGVVIESEDSSVTFDREGMANGITLSVQRGHVSRTISMNSIGRITES